MREIHRHEDITGASVVILDAETTPPSYVIRCDSPGERAVSCPVPEGFLETAFNKIHLGGDYDKVMSE